MEELGWKFIAGMCMFAVVVGWGIALLLDNSEPNEDANGETPEQENESHGEDA